MRKKLVILALVAVVAAGAIAVLRAARASGHDPSAPKSTFSVEQARGFRGFPLYDAGSSVDGIPLVAVLHNASSISFIYGDCVASDDLGCAPPAEVQVWPACVRNISLYDPQAGPPFTRSDVRGAPAFAFEDGHRLEIQTGRSTVVVFGVTVDLVTHVAAALRGVNVPVQAGDRLPPPAAGALEGTLAC
jgi:hypothetical protein